MADEKKRAVDEAHEHENNEWKLSENMNNFRSELQVKFPNLRITSGRRNADNPNSHHHSGDAMDIGKEHTDVYDFLMNTEEGLGMLNRYGLGIIDETDPVMMKKTGATGAHFHIGKDSNYVKEAQDRYNTIDKYFTYDGRPDAKYKKDENGKWTINLGNITDNKYILIETNYEERAALLDKQAKQVVIMPSKRNSFLSNYENFDYSSATVGDNDEIDYPVPLQIIDGSPVNVQHFMKELADMKKKEEEKSKKTKESEARKLIEARKAEKVKKQQDFLKALEDMNSDAVQKEALPDYQKPDQKYQKIDIDFQDQMNLPNLPSIFQIPEMGDGGLLKYEDGGGVISSHGWDYKKEGNKYLTRRTGSEDWIEASGGALEAIKQKIYNESEYTDSQRKSDYKKMVQGLIDKGYSIDDLVDKRIGTRDGLTAMFGDNLGSSNTSTSTTSQNQTATLGRPNQSRSKYAPPSFMDTYFNYPKTMGELFSGANSRQANQNIEEQVDKFRSDFKSKGLDFSGEVEDGIRAALIEVRSKTGKNFKESKQDYVQPDISMTDWQSAPSPGSGSEDSRGRFIQPDITRGDWQQSPKLTTAGKLSKSQKKAQDLFDTEFKVIGEDNFTKAQSNVEKHLEDTKKAYADQGIEFTDKDEKEVRDNAWLSHGVMNLAQLDEKKREEKLKKLQSNSSVLQSILGEDNAANFSNYANRLLVKNGLKDAEGEVVKIKTTDKVKAGEAPDVFYEEIASVKDALSPSSSDKLASYRNQWDNSKGFVYINTPAKSDKRDRNKVYNNVKAVGHFILDASPLEGSTYMHGNNFSFISDAIKNDEYLPVFQNIKGSGGKVNMKYKRPSEMTDEELKALKKFEEYNTKATKSGANKNSVAEQYAKAIDKDKFKIVAPLRQFSFDDIDFNSSSHAEGFKKARVVNTKEGKPTYLLYTNKDKNAYGRFDGVTVSFIFKDKHGNTIVRDYTGPVKGVEEEGNSIKKTYGLKDGDLSVGYHDVGSFSAKPQAKDGKLSVSQWDGFNNESGTGSALIIPQ